MRYFELFFHELNPSGPLINMLKWFLLKVRFCGDICEILYVTPRSRTPRRLTLRGVFPASILTLKASPCLREY